MLSHHKEEPQEFVDSVLREAGKRGASDIYWIPSPDGMDVRLRIDGLPEEATHIPADYGEICITRLKVLAGLLTYRTTVAQDGAIRGHTGTNGAEIRVSVMPTAHGERIALRILGQDSAPRYIENLNLPDSMVALLKRMLAAPTGMLILTGPTGSGKTTTIYALVRELLRQEQDPASIITIEDPIECELPGISQTAVSENREWSYANALRAAMRQDVKTIVVGEMRDREVVKVTLDAALSGHRVITTYHAGDIPAVYARLLHQGFEPFLIATAVTGVVTQRLVPAGNGQGRVPVMAALIPDDEWRDFVAANPGLTQLRRQISEYVEADLSQAAQEMMRCGAISQVEALKISGGIGDT